MTEGCFVCGQLALIVATDKGERTIAVCGRAECADRWAAEFRRPARKHTTGGRANPAVTKLRPALVLAGRGGPCPSS
jgi:hypothetical protein